MSTIDNIEIVKISELNPSQYNPRSWNNNQIAGLKTSIIEFGLIDPIIANKNKNRKNIVIGGHFRLHVANELGIEKVPVVYINLNEQKEKALNVALNNEHTQGNWTPELLPLLKEIESTEPALFEELNLRPLKDGINTNAPDEQEKQENEQRKHEEWVNFHVGDKEGVLHKDIYDLFCSEFDRLSDIVESEEITPVIEAMVANSANTPENSLR